MAKDSATRTQVDSKADQIKAILYLLQTNIEEFQTEVNRAYELLKIGERTKLSHKIECIMDDPLSNIFNISSDVDNQAKIMIDRLVKSFLKHHSQIIKFAYRTKTYFNDLHYSIVLIEDNILNRSQILEFYEKYDLLEISHKFPVFLQFVPVELISKIPTSEEIVTPAN